MNTKFFFKTMSMVMFLITFSGGALAYDQSDPILNDQLWLYEVKKTAPQYDFTVEELKEYLISGEYAEDLLPKLRNTLKKNKGELLDKEGYPLFERITTIGDIFFEFPLIIWVDKKYRYIDPPEVIGVIKQFSRYTNREVDYYKMTRNHLDNRIIIWIEGRFCPRRGCGR